MHSHLTRVIAQGQRRILSLPFSFSVVKHSYLHNYINTSVIPITYSETKKMHEKNAGSLIEKYGGLNLKMSDQIWFWPNILSEQFLIVISGSAN